MFVVLAAGSDSAAGETFACVLCVVVVAAAVFLGVRSGSRRRAAPTASPQDGYVIRTGDGFTFDPDGPERAAEAAQAAYRRHDFLTAFNLYVKAVDRLHDLYSYERFQHRQPSIRDAWIVEGLTSALAAARAADRDADVREGVRTATHRLRSVASAIEQSGSDARLYRSGLDELARLAPDIDVSDIFWT